MRLWRRNRTIQAPATGYMLKMGCPECERYGTYTTRSDTCSHCGHRATPEELEPAFAHDRSDRAHAASFGITFSDHR